MKLKALLISASMVIFAPQLFAQALNGACTSGKVLKGTITAPKGVKGTQYMDLIVEQPAETTCTLRLRLDEATDAIFWETQPKHPSEVLLEAITGGSFSVSPDKKSANLTVIGASSGFIDVGVIQAP